MLLQYGKLQSGSVASAYGYSDWPIVADSVLESHLRGSRLRPAFAIVRVSFVLSRPCDFITDIGSWRKLKIARGVVALMREGVTSSAQEIRMIN